MAEETMATTNAATEPAPPREFVFNGTTLADPDPAMSVDEARKFYADMYPQLTNGTVNGPEEKNGTHVFTFKAAVGTKG